MRAIRIACSLGFEIDPETLAAIGPFSRAIRQVSQERIRDELLRLLTEGGAARGLPLLLDTGILEVILPAIAAMSGVPQPPEFHPEGDVFVHTCLMFEYAGKPNPALALGILLHDVGKPPTFKVEERIRFDGHAEKGAEMAHEICHEMRLSNDLTHRAVELVKGHLKFIHVRDMRESTLKRFLRQDHFEDHLELHRLDCLSSHRDLTNYDFCKAKLEEFGRETVRPRPLLNGHDLIAEGFKPGPVFSRILTEMEDQQLEGTLQTRDQAMEWLRSHPKHP
jgi:poly(A) polymerase